jgi:polar amino acid transport system substrate-binding protein
MNRKLFVVGVIFALLGFVAGSVLPLSPVPIARGQATSLLDEVQARGVLRVATLAGNPPYSSVDAHGQWVGYDIDIANAIAKDLGVKVEFLEVTLAGRIAALQAGKVDLTIANITDTVERSKSIAFSNPYVIVGGYFMVLKKRDDLNTLEDLNKKGIKVVVGRTGTNGIWAPPLVPNAEIVTLEDVADQTQALKSGQVDAFPADSFLLSTLVKQNPETFKLLPGNFSREEIAIGLPRGDWEWLRWVNRWLHEFNLTGRNKELFIKWFGFEPVKLMSDY